MAEYLVTSNAVGYGGLFLLDTDRGKIDFRVKGSFRGITRGADGGWYVVSGSRNTQRDTSTIHRLDAETWRAEPVATHAVKDSHDLKWIDGHFYLVASVGNLILKLDAQCREVDRFQLVPTDGDSCHVNCLCEWNGELYCTVFTLTPGLRREKNLSAVWHTDGKLLRLDFPNKRFEVVLEGLCQPHSFLPQRDGALLVESHTSSLIRVDPTSGRRELLAQYRGFLRGLAQTPQETVMGVCVMYGPDRQRLRSLPWRELMMERIRPFAGVFVLDEEWRVRKRIRLPHSEIYDIVPLEPSPAAGRGLAGSAVGAAP